MKVRELIQDTAWLPGSDYDLNKKPKISVLLPTFRRGKSGLFRRAVESILAQTLSDIELIIVDDASTDGTADQIDEFMRHDGRVSCLRHAKNIGLPAISEYEAYVRARADRISFAFDDTMFNPDALEKLLEAAKKSPWAVIYGHIEFGYFDPRTGETLAATFGTGHKSQGLLRVGNFIPNNAVLMPRAIIEDVGFYDPHIVMARICDWDLWCRVAERYEIKFVDVAVGREDGPLTNDSLGNTYSLDSWTVTEWMGMDRNESLRPANIEDCKVLESKPYHGISTRTVCENLARKHAIFRNWEMTPISQHSQTVDGYVMVVTMHYDASTSLCFDMLPPEIAPRIRLVSYHGGFGEEEMARATCVIFVRRIDAFRPWIDTANTLGIPAYYFLDDNFPMLAENGEATVSGEDYRFKKFRDEMSNFDGVLLSSEKLVAYFEDHLLHRNLIHFPVCYSGPSPLSVDYHEHKGKSEKVLAFAGGSHRAKGLWEIVFPALTRLASEGIRIHLIAPEPGEAYDICLNNLPDAMRVTTLAFEPGYLFAMRRIARFNPDFLVHAPSITENNEFKTLNVLLSSNLIDAAPILPDMPPYDEVKGLGNVVIVPDPFKPVSWYETLKEIFTGKYDIEDIKARNHTFCAENFSGTENVRILRDILQRHGGEVSWSEQAARLHKLAAWLRLTTGLKAIEKTAEPVDEQACELAAYRRVMRYSWRHRIMRANSDLWSSIAHDFDSLKKSSVENGWRKLGSSLELSDSLHDIDFREYRINPPTGKIAAVMFAVSVDLVCRGQIGVEVVTPDDRIKDHVVIDLDRQSLNKPVKFELSDVNAKAGETWKIRVFAHSKTPVYIYEFINRKLFGLRFAHSTPFMELIVK